MNARALVALLLLAAVSLGAQAQAPAPSSELTRAERWRDEHRQRDGMSPGGKGKSGWAHSEKKGNVKGRRD